MKTWGGGGTITETIKKELEGGGRMVSKKPESFFISVCQVYVAFKGDLK